MKLYRLIYISDAADYIEWIDLKDILLQSQKNNAKLDITGLLVVITRKFVQVLEGPEEHLNVLYSKILQDSRHNNSYLLSYTPIDERHFGEWPMQGIDLAMVQPEFKEFLIGKYGQSADGEVAIPEDPEVAYNLLCDVYTDSKS
jgi:hypothetical protein